MSQFRTSNQLGRKFRGLRTLPTLGLAGAAMLLFATAAGNAKPPASPANTAKPNSAIVPVSRTDPWWVQRHDLINARAKKGDIGLVFLGDSITQGWEREGKDVWEKFYGNRRAANFGISGDRTQHVLWRLDHGILESLGKSPPKLVVLMIGTNNSNASDNTAPEIAEGIDAIVKRLRAKLPTTKVLLLAIFPRNEKPNAQREKNAEASRLASRAADGKNVFYLDIGPKFLKADGTLSKEIMPDLLHLSPKGYTIWAESIEPKVRELLGKGPKKAGPRQ
jgi:lysophospholipase L1-like esterase